GRSPRRRPSPASRAASGASTSAGAGARSTWSSPSAGGTISTSRPRPTESSPTTSSACPNAAEAWAASTAGESPVGGRSGGVHPLNEDAEAAALLRCGLDGDGGTSDGQFGVASRKQVL